jgi:hypothetical protein
MSNPLKSFIPFELGYLEVLNSQHKQKRLILKSEILGKLIQWDSTEAASSRGGR